MPPENQLKVLIADDDDAMRFAMCRVIEAEGYAVIAASDGDMAISLYKKERPDVVLLDAMMPKKDGYEVCQRLREEVPDIHLLPILIITVMDDNYSLTRAQEVGASDYLIKPVQWPLLIYRLNMLFMQKRLHDERRRTEGRLRQTHRLNAIRQLTAGFAHDFNNILATQLGYTELALNTCEQNNTKLNQYLGEVQKASLRGKLLIEQLMTFAMDAIDNWAFSQADLDRLFLRVFSDNDRAIRLYERCGFVGVKEIPLHKFEEGEVIKYEEIESSQDLSVDKKFLLMELLKK